MMAFLVLIRYNDLMNTKAIFSIKVIKIKKRTLTDNHSSAEVRHITT